jgi:hypothetical protein
MPISVCVSYGALTRLLRIRVLLGASPFAIGSLASPAHHFLSFSNPESLKLWKIYMIEMISLDPLQRAVRSTPVKASIPNCSLQYIACRLSVRITKPRGERAGFAIISFTGVSRKCSTHTVGLPAAS